MKNHISTVQHDPKAYCFMKKTRVRKSHATVPLSILKLLLCIKIKIKVHISGRIMYLKSLLLYFCLIFRTQYLLGCPCPPSCPVQTCPVLPRCPTLVCPAKKDDGLAQEKMKIKKEVVMECEDEALPRWVWITVPCLVLCIVILLIAIVYIVYKFADKPGQKLGKCSSCSEKIENPVQLVIDNNESCVTYHNSTRVDTCDQNNQTMDDLWDCY